MPKRLYSRMVEWEFVHLAELQGAFETLQQEQKLLVLPACSLPSQIIAIQIAQAITFLHTATPLLAHLDIKPASSNCNIIPTCVLWFSINQGKEEIYKGPKHMDSVLCGLNYLRVMSKKF